MKKVDITGQRFGRLIALSNINGPYWLCKCDCGETKNIVIGSLRRGLTKSCGCLRKEVTGKRCYKHGAGVHQTKAYRAWNNMMRRCYKEIHPKFKYWGGRGITVCKEWHEFSNFLVDMGNPEKGLTLDRIDVNGNYEPDNCRWATQEVQIRNRRISKIFSIDGNIVSLKEACQIVGITICAVSSKVYKKKISFIEAFKSYGIKNIEVVN